MCWIGQPLSASDLKRILDKKGELSRITYHVGALFKMQAIVLVGEHRGRGAMEKFYSLR